MDAFLWAVKLGIPLALAIAAMFGDVLLILGAQPAKRAQ